MIMIKGSSSIWTVGNDDPMHEVRMYPSQNNSRMEKTRVKQEEEAVIRIIVKEKYDVWKKRKWARRVTSSKQSLTSVKELLPLS